jgi:PX domain
MSSEEEDNYQPAKRVAAKQTPADSAPQKKQVEETTELDAQEQDEEDDHHEDDGDNKAVYSTRSKITASVSNPQLKDGGTFSKKYTDYEVSGADDSGPFAVRRRYKEFNELRSKLVENWPGYFIPPIPEKQTTGNTDPEFVRQRQHALNHFMARCAKLPHIFRSQEMQMFIRSTGDVSKLLAGVKPLSPHEMYLRNIEKFPECNKEVTEKVEKSVKKYFKTLDSTIEFFVRFRNVAKNLQQARSSFKHHKTQFLKYAVNDYKNKLKLPEAKKEVEDRLKEYQGKERLDDLSDFVRSIKDLLLDLKSFALIKADLELFLKQIDKLRKSQSEAQKNLAKVQSQEADIIKEGMFKKVSKVERIAQLEKEISDNQRDIEALEKNRSFTFFLLNYHEFPILINDKRLTFAQGILGFAGRRHAALELEIDLLKTMHQHYRKY